MNRRLITLHPLYFPDLASPAHLSAAASVALAALAPLPLLATMARRPRLPLFASSRIDLVRFLFLFHESLSNPGDQVLRCLTSVLGMAWPGSRSRFGLRFLLILDWESSSQSIVDLLAWIIRRTAVPFRHNLRNEDSERASPALIAPQAAF